MSSVFDGRVSYLGTIFVALLVLPEKEADGRSAGSFVEQSLLIDPSIVSQYEEITVHIIFKLTLKQIK